MNLEEPTPTEILRSHCRYYGINHTADALWMEEFNWDQGLFDMLTIDLRTWAVRGYEIKVSRGDFLADKKWQNYLPFVNFFYFATPPGLVKASEVPDDIGLLELDQTPDAKGKPRVCLQLKKRGRRLQPTFVRRTYGELFITRVLLRYIRNIQWRRTRTFFDCPGCGIAIPVGDTRSSGGGLFYGGPI